MLQTNCLVHFKTYQCPISLFEPIFLFHSTTRQMCNEEKPRSPPKQQQPPPTHSKYFIVLQELFRFVSGTQKHIHYIDTNSVKELSISLSASSSISSFYPGPVGSHLERTRANFSIPRLANYYRLHPGY